MIDRPVQLDVVDYAAAWGLVYQTGDDEREVELWGLASILRREVNRHGAATTREIFDVVVPVLQTLGIGPAFAKKQTRRLLEEMATLGEVERLRGGSQTSWCRPITQYIAINETRGAILGTDAELAPHVDPPIDRMAQFVRWVNLDNDAIRSSVDDLDVQVRQLEDWAGLPDWCDDQIGLRQLPELWHLHVARLVESGQPVTDDPKSIRVLLPTPGAFFGKCGTDPSGRWTPAIDLPNGVQLAALRGHSEAHWHPFLVNVEDGRPTIAMPIGDWDHFYWLLLARGVAKGNPETLSFDEDER